MLAQAVMVEPGALVTVLVGGLLYARGVGAVWRRAGHGRGIREWQALAFTGALLAVLFALESPLDVIGTDLFSAHMIQHLLLILLAGPLLAMSKPFLALLWGLPAGARRGMGRLWRWAAPLHRASRFVSRPAIAFGLHSLALWGWHLPVWYEAAQANPWVHVLEHASFLGTAVLFWWALIPSAHSAGVLYVFGLAVQSTALGALLTFSRKPWYTSHLATAPAWGLSPLEDQQLAGLIMWVPGGVIYLVLALALFAVWLRAAEPRARPTLTHPEGFEEDLTDLDQTHVVFESGGADTSVLRRAPGL